MKKNRIYTCHDYTLLELDSCTLLFLINDPSSSSNEELDWRLIDYIFINHSYHSELVIPRDLFHGIIVSTVPIHKCMKNLPNSFKSKSLGYGEEYILDSFLRIIPIPSGLGMGSCHWMMYYHELKILVVGQSCMHSVFAKPFSRDSFLFNKDRIDYVIYHSISMTREWDVLYSTKDCKEELDLKSLIQSLVLQNQCILLPIHTNGLGLNLLSILESFDPYILMSRERFRSIEIQSEWMNSQQLQGKVLDGISPLESFKHHWMTRLSDFQAVSLPLIIICELDWISQLTSLFQLCHTRCHTSIIYTDPFLPRVSSNTFHAKEIYIKPNWMGLLQELELHNLFYSLYHLQVSPPIKTPLPLVGLKWIASKKGEAQEVDLVIDNVIISTNASSIHSAHTQTLNLKNKQFI